MYSKNMHVEVLEDNMDPSANKAGERVKILPASFATQRIYTYSITPWLTDVTIQIKL
jgi:hypothetical protein